MDSNGFDRLVRFVGSGRSRRAMLKTVAGGVIAAAAGAVELNGADAAARKRGLGVVCSKNADCVSGVCSPRDRTGRRTCGCPASLTNCGGDCVDVAVDGNNCGACGQSCAAIEGQTAFCLGGVCQCPDCLTGPCPAGSQCDDGACICLELGPNRLVCAGPVFVYADAGRCDVDSDCPDPGLPSNLGPYKVVCYQGGSICAVLFPCGAAGPPP